VRNGFKGAPDLATRAIKGSRERWLESKAKAEAAGEELAGRFAHLPSPDKVILMGHSLGCRAIKTCLENLADDEIKVREVHLLGAAVPAGESWTRASRAVRGVITNYYSKNDNILNIPYHAAELLSGIRGPKNRDLDFPAIPAGFSVSPAGLKGISRSGKKIKNIDVSAFVNRHAGFEENLHRFIKFRDCH